MKKIHIKSIEKKLNIKFLNKTLIIDALTHKSLNQSKNNEKLEFLGDRVIGLVISKKLFDMYPNDSEGVLDKKFANLVNRKSCSDIGWDIGIQNLILTGNNKKIITKKDEKILSDSCEALIGCIYIDQGFEFVKNYILKVWKNKVDNSHIAILDPKTKLQEYSLKIYKKLPIYKFITSSGPKHRPTFKVSVFITGSKKFIGSGSSKQLAELDGALKLLKNINIK
jgi:ribonuclease III